MNTSFTKHAFLLFFSTLFIGTGFSQSEKTVAIHSTKTDAPLAALTQLMLKKNYSAEAISDMQTNYPEKLLALNYYYSNSFKVKEGQKYSEEQFLKIDVSQLDKYRLADAVKEVKDSASGLTLLLDSQNTVKKAIKGSMEAKEAAESTKN